eukprot:scaffold150_cov242-Prasinococcus_capsulatus_cf.AAC.2
MERMGKSGTGIVAFGARKHANVGKVAVARFSRPLLLLAQPRLPPRRDQHQSPASRDRSA